MYPLLTDKAVWLNKMWYRIALVLRLIVFPSLVFPPPSRTLVSAIGPHKGKRDKPGHFSRTTKSSNSRLTYTALAWSEAMRIVIHCF